MTFQLHHETVASPDAQKTLLTLHGIFGAGRNWQSVMRDVTAQRPDWSATLVDIREHGKSVGAPQPHTVDACANDLGGIVSDFDQRAVLGHSFGGKVTLAHLGDSTGDIRQAWIIDSTPDQREPSGMAWDMLQLLKTLPTQFERRDDAVRMLCDNKVPYGVAAWMATNLQRVDDRMAWRIDPDSMDALLTDFFETDLWQVVEQPPEGVEIHFVKAEESDVLTESACERIQGLNRENNQVFLHRVAGGHWVNVSNPTALVSVLTENLF